MPLNKNFPMSGCSGVVLIGFKSSGECVIDAAGDIGIEDAEIIAKNLILLAARIRNSARLGAAGHFVH